MRPIFIMAMLCLPVSVHAGEGSHWHGRPIARVIEQQGAPDKIVPGWVCAQNIEYLKTYGYDKWRFLKGTPYGDDTSICANHDTQFHDIYHYTKPLIPQSGQRLNCNIHLTVQDGIIVGVGSGCFGECQATQSIFSQWMHGEVPKECIAYD